jgi:hypothetical protein
VVGVRTAIQPTVKASPRVLGTLTSLLDGLELGALAQLG